MNDNYLWDRTGEAVAEVQRLEELLGTLSYQPKPLQIPASIKFAGKRNYAALAIAAALALLVLAAGIWIRVRNFQSAPPIEAKHGTITPVAVPAESPIDPDRVAVKQEPPAPNPIRHSQRIAVGTIHKTRVRPEEPQLTAAEMAQKDQLITALRLVSAKLNLAQRKSQGLPQTNNIHNQHRIG